MAEYFWELIQHDGTRIEIAPSVVPVVKRRLGNGEPINTRTMSIPANQVRTFRQTDKPYNPQHLLDSASQAFNTPLINPDGSIQYRWVKRSVTQRKWDSYYSGIPSYRRIGNDDGMVVMAFKLPTHEVDTLTTPYLTDEEVDKINLTTQ